MMLKRNVPLPDMAPVTKRAGLTDDIAGMAVGDSGIVAYKASAVRQACKRVLLAMAEANVADAGDYIFAVWPSNSDGSAHETGLDFAQIARITPEQAAKYEAQRAGSTISLANLTNAVDEQAA